MSSTRTSHHQVRVEHEKHVLNTVHGTRTFVATANSISPKSVLSNAKHVLNTDLLNTDFIASPC